MRLASWLLFAAKQPLLDSHQSPGQVWGEKWLAALPRPPPAMRPSSLLRRQGPTEILDLMPYLARGTLRCYAARHALRKGAEAEAEAEMEAPQDANAEGSELWIFSTQRQRDEAAAAAAGEGKRGKGVESVAVRVFLLWEEAVVRPVVRPGPGPRPVELGAGAQAQKPAGEGSPTQRARARGLPGPLGASEPRIPRGLWVEAISIRSRVSRTARKT